jgi:hypothetical protein
MKSKNEIDLFKEASFVNFYKSLVLLKKAKERHDFLERRLHNEQNLDYYDTLWYSPHGVYSLGGWSLKFKLYVNSIYI